MGGSCFSLFSLAEILLRRSATAAGLTSQTVEIDGGETNIHFWGPPPNCKVDGNSSKPKLVLIHGFGPPSIWQWNQQISFFAREFQVYVPDLIFFGDSYTKSSERSEVFQATCIVKLLEKLEVQRYTVVGTSYGGFVAYNIAKSWPERVEKVVIASSAVNMRRSDNNRLLNKAKVDKIEDLLVPRTTKELYNLIGFCLLRRPYIPGFILSDMLQKLFSESIKEKLELLEGLNIGRDETVNVSPLSQETLIIWGEGDQIFLLEKATELNKLLGDRARLEVIKNSGHIPQGERPKEFNNILNKFLQGQSSLH